jgi:NADH dehydrogenase FAD-containing subunit
VLLVGAGHAHLHVTLHAAQFSKRGVELTMIAPEDFWYSGLATGVLGGQYAPGAHEVKISSLLGDHGSFIQDSVVELDAATQRVRLAGGERIFYDLLSLNVGSMSMLLQGATGQVFAVKPLHELTRLRAALELAKAEGERLRIIVAGGGPSGCEIAANIRALLCTSGGEVTLLASGDRLVPIFSPAVSAGLHRWLRQNGITVYLKTGLQRVEGNTAITSEGEELPFDFLVNATGLRPPELLARTGLPCSARGELIVDSNLRSIRRQSDLCGW